MLLGEYSYNIDSKGRVAIPAKLREKFAEGLVLARGFDKCITVYPMPEWKVLAEKLASLPITQSSVRKLSRFTFSNAFSAELDRQGRVIIPLSLREYANIDLESEVMVVGLHQYLEIWDKESWFNEKEGLDEQGWEIAEGTEILK